MGPILTTLFFLISTCLSTLVPTSQAPQPTTFSDLTYSGLYKIVNCNANLPARLYPESKQLQSFLPQVWNSSKLLLDDITSGTNSKHGFEALFKTNTSIGTVSSTIRSMRYGANVGPHDQVPTMICLDSTSKDPFFQGLYEQTCLNGTIAAAIPNSSYIGFCPGFFTLDRRGLDFPIPPSCPVMIANSIQDAPHPLMHNTYPIFLAQMLRLQMETGLIEGDVKNQVHHIQDCVNLNVSASLTNIANWANYAACKSSRSLMFGDRSYLW